MCWDGKAVHLCSLMAGGPQVLVGALADRLLLANRWLRLVHLTAAGAAFGVVTPRQEMAEPLNHTARCASLATGRCSPGRQPEQCAVARASRRCLMP